MNALQLGNAVVSHTRRTRRHRDRDRFPLTGGWIKAVTRKLGKPVGRDRAYDIQHALIESGMIEEAGSYEKLLFGHKTGFKVKLWRLGRALRADSSSVPDASRQVVRVTRQNWWADPLMGTPDGRPPPKRLLRRACGWGGHVEYEVWV